MNFMLPGVSCSFSKKIFFYKVVSSNMGNAIANILNKRWRPENPTSENIQTPQKYDL